MRLDYSTSRIVEAVVHARRKTTAGLLYHSLFPCGKATRLGLAPGKPVPQAIITTLPPDEHPPHNATVGSPGFYSISLLDDVINPSTGGVEYAYKIFSPAAVSVDFLADLLGVEEGEDGEG